MFVGKLGTFVALGVRRSRMNVNCSFNDKITWRYRNGIALQIQDFNIDKQMFVLYYLITKEQMFLERVCYYIIL